MYEAALIGVGYWGSVLRRYIEENENFYLKYVCDSTSDLTEVWNDRSVSAVVVATPNRTHYRIVKLALLHGKHVLSEKPLALKTSECEELREIALRDNLSLVVEYTYTFSRSLIGAKRMIDAGEIGAILGIEAAVRHLGRFGAESCYWLLGSHMLSILGMFVPLTSLCFRKIDLVTYDGQVETGVISFEGAISGQIAVSLNYPGKETRVIIYGEKGSIVYDPTSQSSLLVEKYTRLPWVVASKLPRESVEYPIDETNNLLFAIEYFSRVLHQEEESNIDQAVEITRILESLQTADIK